MSVNFLKHSTPIFRLRKIKNTLLSTIPLFTLLIVSCEKELDFKYRDIDPILVIEGALTQSGADVSLTLTTPMSEPMDRQHLTDAAVLLSDLTSGAEYALSPDNEGVYTSPVPGIVGHSYRLTVTRDGKVYSAVSLMRPPVEITGMEFSWIKMPYDYVAALQVSFTDETSTVDDCYWMRLYRNGEAYKWAEINDIHSSEGIIDKVMMTSRSDLDEEDDADKLEDGDIVRATVVPISREMHDYLEALSIGNSNGPRMFSGPLCLGYFLAAPVTEKSISFTAYHP